MKLHVKHATQPLRGTLRVPGDKSIGHRCLMFASIGDGRSQIHGLSGGLDNESTQKAFEQMGVSIEVSQTEHGQYVVVDGVGLHGLRAPDAPIDCGNSGTTMRLMAGLLSGQSFATTMIGDVSLSRRPMRRVTEPLRSRGADIRGVSFTTKQGIENEHPPLEIQPTNNKLKALHYTSPVSSAQVKSSLLLAGLYAEGTTAITEPARSRDHTERMFRALELPISSAGNACFFDPRAWDQKLPAFNWFVPGDFSSASFLIAAACMIQDSDITLTHVGVNETRVGFLHALRAMGADISMLPCSPLPPGVSAAGDEAMADIRIRYAELRGTQIDGKIIATMIDEIPAFAAVASVAEEPSTVRDAAELRVKESDRISIMLEILAAFGVSTTEFDDGMSIDGRPMQPACVDSHHDHRIAMSAALLALASTGETQINGADCIATSYPSFDADLRSLGAELWYA